MDNFAEFLTPTVVSGIYGLLFERCNNFYNDEKFKAECIPLKCCNLFIGYTKRKYVPALTCNNTTFYVKNDTLYISDKYKNSHERSQALREVFESIKKSGSINLIDKWRNEEYGVFSKSGQLLFSAERSVTPLLGVARYGVHINGYVLKGDGDPLKLSNYYMWLGVRAKIKSDPGMWDNMVGGGSTHGLSPTNVAIKEAAEEASLGEEFAKCLRPTGCLTCFYANDRGSYAEAMYCYDILLPSSFKPINDDGEVESFKLFPLSHVLQLIISDEFKACSALVALDFLIRHGFISPDKMSCDYIGIQCMMKQPFPFD